MKKLLNAAFAALMLLSVMYGIKIFCASEEMDYYISANENVIIEDAETIILPKMNLKKGNYTLHFEYSAVSPITLTVLSVAEYDVESDSYKIYYTDTLSEINNKYAASFHMDDNTQLVSVVLSSEEKSLISVQNVLVKSESPQFKDRYIYLCFYILCLSAIFAVLFYIINSKKVTDKFEVSIFALLLTAVIIMSCYYYISAENPYGHDVRFHFLRVSGIAQSINEGIIPQRVNSVFNYGYGYINAIMYPELFLYIPGYLASIGMSVFGAIKIFYFIINIFTVLFSYYSFKGISQNRYSAFIACIIYSLSFYRLENIYVRSAMGEALFMMFLPLAVYALYSIFYSPRKRWILMFLSVSAIVQSHILGTVMTGALLAVLFVIFSMDTVLKKQWTKECVLLTIKSAFCCVMANLWFLVPFAYYYFTQPLMFFDRAVQIENFFIRIIPFKSFISLSLVRRNIIENMGIVVTCGAVVCIVLQFFALFEKGKNLFLTVSVLVGAIITAVLITDITPWQALSQNSLIQAFMAAIQFSFRFYGLYICLIALLFSLLAPKKIKTSLGYMAVIAAMIIAAIGTSDFYTNGEIVNYYGYELAESSDAPNEYLMEAANIVNEIANPHKLRASDNITVSSYSKIGYTVKVKIEKTDGEIGFVKLPLLYYFGYSAITETGQRLKVSSAENGILAVEIPADLTSAVIHTEFGNKLIFDLPLVVSSIFVILCIGYFFKKFLSEKRRKNGKA